MSEAHVVAALKDKRTELAVIAADLEKQINGRDRRWRLLSKSANKRKRATGDAAPSRPRSLASLF